MHNIASSSDRLFCVGDTTAVELGEADVPQLQTFFSANPDYFLAVHGEPPQPDEARREFFDRPPSAMPFDKVQIVGFVDVQGSLIAITSIISNLLAEHVWHISLFIVATTLHGTGIAHALYAGLEQWLVEQDAWWLRLGAVSGYKKAERFWIKQGYVEVRRRRDVQLGQQIHTIGVFVKPLNTRGLADYLSVVVRDRPDSTLP